MKEQISALLDGEGSDLERARTLQALSADPALRGTWERYHLVSAAIRRELDLIVSSDVADRIQHQLQQEIPVTNHRRTLTPRALKFTAGLAIAATVATVAILSIPPLVSPAVVTAARTTANKNTVADARPLPPDQQSALNEYLVRHGEFTPAAGMNGMLSYVRVIGRDSASTRNINAE